MINIKTISQHANNNTHTQHTYTKQNTIQNKTKHNRQTTITKKQTRTIIKHIYKNNLYAYNQTQKQTTCKQQHITQHIQHKTYKSQTVQTHKPKHKNLQEKKTTPNNTTQCMKHIQHNQTQQPTQTHTHT